MLTYKWLTNSTTSTALVQWSISIYNVDKTGVLRQKACRAVKITADIVLGANMDGSDEIKPLIIGKAAKPRGKTQWLYNLNFI